MGGFLLLSKSQQMKEIHLNQAKLIDKSLRMIISKIFEIINGRYYTISLKEQIVISHWNLQLVLKFGTHIEYIIQ